MDIIDFETRDGLRLVASRYGDAGAPAILMTHGGGQTRHAWDRTGEALALAGYRVVNLDLRGHGESGWAADGDYSLDAFARDLEDVARQVDADAVSLVGASLGGMASLIAAGEGHVTATRLVLVDVVPRVERAGAARIQAFMARTSGGFESLEQAADAVAGYIPERPRPPSTAGLEKNLRKRDDGRWYWRWDPAFLNNRSLQNSNGPVRMESAAGRLTCPTLLVRGVLSDVVSLEGVEALRRVVPHLQVCDVGEAGHMVAGDRNDAFTSAVAEFLCATPDS